MRDHASAGVRPGAMTQAMRAVQRKLPGPNWIRCALVEDARIIHEHQIAPSAAPMRDLEGLGIRIDYRAGSWWLSSEGEVEARIGGREPKVMRGEIDLSDGGPNVGANIVNGIDGLRSA